MSAIGAIVRRETSQDTLARARARAALIPDLMIEARMVASNVFAGWHGRRKRGIGEDFWQFRPYVAGENMAAIDWRRSARDEHIYVRDREWQATHTIWLWVDESPSMLYKSTLASVAKQSRSLVIAFALAELLARSGERIGWLGLTAPVLSRHAAERLGEALLKAPPQTSLPSPQHVRAHSDLVLMSDFLGDIDELGEKLRRLARQGARGHLVQVVDPAELVFPYSGHVEFADPESGRKLSMGNARSIRVDYEALFARHVESVRSLASAIGWTHTLHRTDRLASQALSALHVHMTGFAGARD